MCLMSFSLAFVHLQVCRPKRCDSLRGRASPVENHAGQGAADRRQNDARYYASVSLQQLR